MALPAGSDLHALPLSVVLDVVGDNTATQNSSAFGTLGATGLILRTNVHTVAGATPSLVATIQGWDSGAGVWYTLVAGAAITTGADTGQVLQVDPRVPSAANVVAQRGLPAKCRVQYTTTSGGSAQAFTGEITFVP